MLHSFRSAVARARREGGLYFSALLLKIVSTKPSCLQEQLGRVGYILPPLPSGSSSPNASARTIPAAMPWRD